MGFHSERLLDILRAAQTVAEQADIRSVASRTTSVQFEANRLKQVQTKEGSSVALRNVSFREMVEDIKKGLIVEHVIGASQGNLLGGDFGGNVLLGYKVENGEIVGRVKDTMMGGNVFEVLGELCGIGREARWGEVVLHTPAL